LVVIRWAEIYHFTMKSARSGEGGINKLSPLVVGVNVFMYLLFIVLFIVFLTVPSGNIAVNCKTGYLFKSHTTAAEVVSHVYNLFFAIVCIALAGLYGLYGYRILSLMTESGRGAAKTSAMKQKYFRLVVISCVCTVALLVQAALLIHATFSSGSRSIYAVVPIILFAEVIPTIIFLFMFSKTSSFIKRVRTSSRTASGTTKSGTSMTDDSKVDTLELDTRDPVSNGQIGTNDERKDGSGEDNNESDEHWADELKDDGGGGNAHDDGGDAHNDESGGDAHNDGGGDILYEDDD